MGSYPYGNAAGPEPYPPTQDEKTMALLAHVLGIFSGFIAPLIFFLVKKDSKFVSFHALQSLAWHIIYFACVFVAMAIFIVSMIISGGFANHNSKEFPMAFFGFFGVIWLTMIGGALLNIILGIVFGIKAHSGEWAKFPVLGNWILKKIVFS